MAEKVLEKSLISVAGSLNLNLKESDGTKLFHLLRNAESEVKMKIFLLLASLLVGFLGSSPANAIFGFSKCERIQKEVLSLEDKFSGYLSKVKGNYHTNKLWLIDERIFILTDAAVVSINRAIRLDPIPKIWKLAYNNPKCFTNSQKLRIKEMKTMVTRQFISYYEGKQYRNTGKCNGGSIEGYEQRERDCFIKNVNILGNYTLYESIYSY